ncbi:MAG: beta-N-acetylhexosaminidase [Candidatus Neomarinimicrobiota bacterium]|nr:MAG: beta-N-acetylhexosaminidase [Candidatus Neomarinimicrobiota bacterium]
MKSWKIMAILFALVVMMTSCGKDTGKIDVSWQLIQNQYKVNNQHKCEVTFTNNSQYTLTNDNWEFYFTWFRSIKKDQEWQGLGGETINGDFNRIYPTESFTELKPGESMTFPLIGSHYAIHRSDAISGCYFVINKGLSRKIILSSGETNVLPFPKDARLVKGPYDHLKVQTAEMTYKENSGIRQIPRSNLLPIFPSPDKISLGEGTCEINKDFTIYYHSSLANEARFLQEKLSEVFGENIIRTKFRSDDFNINGPDRIILNRHEGKAESYTLNVDTKKGIVINGADEAGVFYGIQSLLSLFPPDLNKVPEKFVSIPCIDVVDGPRFPYRGMHIDVSRSFHSKQNIMKFMELISGYKLNKLHFHITDDEGWRVEIRSIPELTEIGAFRGHTNDEKDHLQPSLGSGPFADPEIGNGSGFYTREDFIELLRFAKSRHIEVIPEIDMPGHMRSALKAMEVRYDRYMEKGKPDSALMYLLTDFEDTTYYTSAQRYHDNTANPCMESTYRFAQVVIDELVAMYKEADAPLSTLHIGGDEVPKGAFTYSPICRAFLESQDEYNSPSELHKYFTKRVTDMLKVYGIHTAGWEEVACKHIDGKRYPDPTLVQEGIITYVWNNVWGWGAEDLGYQLANEGFPVILIGANNFYFDFAYNRDPEEEGLNWGGYTDTRSAWEFTPYDITKCANTTLYGDPITDEMFEGKTRLTREGKKNILGLSGTLWSETMRTWERMEYMAFPKILGLAERAWSLQPYWSAVENKDFAVMMREMDWNQFVNKVGQYELPKLDQQQVKYRIPLPGAIIEDNVFKANIRFPGLTLRYTLDGSEPGETSDMYIKPFKVDPDDKIKIAAFNKLGRSSRVVTLP